MARRAMLHKHPKTSVYYFRKRIPNDLVSVIGKREFKKSLDTKDRKEADRRVVAVEHEFNQLLERAKRGANPCDGEKICKAAIGVSPLLLYQCNTGEHTAELKKHYEAI